MINVRVDWVYNTSDKPTHLCYIRHASYELFPLCTAYLLAHQPRVEIFICWLLNVPATCECVSGTDLLRQLYVLPH